VFFEPIVEIGFRGFVASRDKTLRGTVGEEAFDLRPIRIEFTFPRSTRSS